jgi:predicted nucleic acid-binding protein
MPSPDDAIVGVVNSTPLIALSIVGHLDLLRHLFDELFIPASVYREVVRIWYVETLTYHKFPLRRRDHFVMIRVGM